MAAPARESTKLSKKPGIPRPSAIRQSLGKISVSKAISDVIGNGHSQGNKENAADLARHTVTVTLKAPSRDLDTSEFGKISVKTPLSTVKATQTKVDTQSSTLNQSPTSVRKAHGYSASVPTISNLRPRESGGNTSLPKYRPKGSLLPLKHTTLTRKRKNSLIEEEEGTETDDPSPTESKKMVNRTISPLPRRTRVESTASDSSRIFEAKVMLKTSQQRTPTKQKTGSGSTPSSVRVRTTSTNSSRHSVPQKINTGSPVARTEKRPRLSEESRHAKAPSTLANSTSTISADLSSDSIDIADVSALLSVSPNVSPVKSIAPSSVRRVAIRRTANVASEPEVSSRKAAISTLPSRSGAAYLAPPSNVTTRRGGQSGLSSRTSRKSILSWADFSNAKIDEDVNLIAEIKPLQGIITPGSDEHHPRERIDSGWGPQDNSRLFPSGPSIGQLMFPSVLSKPPKLEDTLPPDGDAVAARLLRIKLTDAEQEIIDLRAKVKALQNGVSPMSPAIELSIAPSPTESNAASEIALQRLQNAELEAKTAFLEEALATTHEAMAVKTAELERSSHIIHRLEEECEEERRKGEISIKAIMDEIPTRVNRTVEEVSAQRVAAAVSSVDRRWSTKLQFALTAEQGLGCWKDVKSMALNDLEAVRQSMATLKVLAAGIESLKLDTINAK